MDPVLAAVLASATTVLASSGFWAWLAGRNKAQKAFGRLLMGLAYDKITHLGVAYIERGYISKDEYEEFEKYLYQPYKDMGGNGVAERIMAEVRALPMRSPAKYSEILHRTNMENHDERLH